jgi:hypothetical protein
LSGTHPDQEVDAIISQGILPNADSLNIDTYPCGRDKVFACPRACKGFISSILQNNSRHRITHSSPSMGTTL